MELFLQSQNNLIFLKVFHTWLENVSPEFVFIVCACSLSYFDGYFLFEQFSLQLHRL